MDSRFRLTACCNVHRELPACASRVQRRSHRRAPGRIGLPSTGQRSTKREAFVHPVGAGAAEAVDDEHVARLVRHQVEQIPVGRRNGDETERLGLRIRAPGVVGPEIGLGAGVVGGRRDVAGVREAERANGGRVLILDDLAEPRDVLLGERVRPDEERDALSPGTRWNRQRRNAQT
jgi:hypothetical protein